MGKNASVKPKGFGFGPTKEESLALISDLLVATLLKYYQNNMGGLDKMMLDLSPQLDRKLEAAVRQAQQQENKVEN